MNNAMFSFFINVGNKFSDDFMFGVNTVRSIQKAWCENNNIDYICADDIALAIWNELKLSNENWAKISFISASDYIRVKILDTLLNKYDNVCYIDSDILLYHNFDITKYFKLTNDNKKITIYREYWFDDVDSYLLLDGDPLDYTKVSPTDVTHNKYNSYVNLENVKLNNGLMIFNNNEKHKAILNNWAKYCEQQVMLEYKNISNNFTYIGVKYSSDTFTNIDDLNIIYNGNMMSVQNEFHIQHNSYYADVFFTILDAILKDNHNTESMFMNLSTLSVMSSWIGVINVIHKYKNVYSYEPISMNVTCYDLNKVFSIRDQVEKDWVSHNFIEPLKKHANPLWIRNTQVGKYDRFRRPIQK
jgi:hypothetical protein